MKESFGSQTSYQYCLHLTVFPMKGFVQEAKGCQFSLVLLTIPSSFSEQLTLKRYLTLMSNWTSIRVLFWLPSSPSLFTLFNLSLCTGSSSSSSLGLFLSSNMAAMAASLDTVLCERPQSPSFSSIFDTLVLTFLPDLVVIVVGTLSLQVAKSSSLSSSLLKLRQY